jgi:hypothetical protein
VRHRELKSDLLLVRPVGADRWVQFRDVFEVDGRPVRDRNQRLMKLFVTPSSSTRTRPEQIANESSRYNIGNLQRTVNLPVLALAVLEPRGQPRFVFKRIEKGGQVPVRSAAAAAKTVWVIGYREVEGQTMIRTTNFRDMPARGRFWIEPESGEVLATELIAEDLSVRGMITVGYEREPALNVMVPIQMQERYDLRRGPSPVDGRSQLPQLPAVPGEGRREDCAGRQRMTATCQATIVSACVAVTLARPAAASEPESLATVLARAAAYVAEFHRQLSTIVAEERYVQDWKAIQGGRHPASTRCSIENWSRMWSW